MHYFIVLVGLAVLACLVYIMLDASRVTKRLIKSDCDSFRFLLEGECLDREWSRKQGAQ